VEESSFGPPRDKAKAMQGAGNAAMGAEAAASAKLL